MPDMDNNYIEYELKTNLCENCNIIEVVDHIIFFEYKMFKGHPLRQLNEYLS